LGAGIPGAVEMADQLDELTYKRSQARSIRDAYLANKSYLNNRHRLSIGILPFAASVIAIVLMLMAGAFLPARKSPRLPHLPRPSFHLQPHDVIAR